MSGLVYQEIVDALQAIVPPGAVFEIRMLGDRKGQIDSGYFNSPSEAATALCAAQGWHQGVYITPNPLSPDLLARSANRIKEWARYTTDDTHVTKRAWLLVDIDAKRLTGISSSEDEHQRALKLAHTIAGVLSLYGFPAPMVNDSGNGAHLMYAIDEPNTDDVREEIHSFLQTLKMLYDTEHCEVDTTVYNASRIWRLPGTWARKGDSTPDRPHRKAAIVKRADQFSRLSIIKVARFNAQFQEQLKAKLAAGKPVTQGPKRAEPEDEKLYSHLNRYALANPKLWVTHFFPSAREYKEGYRIASADIGQSYEEDLTIHPMPLGIKYFGVADQGDHAEGRRTPIGVIAEYALNTDKQTAAEKLSAHINFPISEFGDISAGLNGGANGITASGDGVDPLAGLLGAKQRYSFKGIRSIQELSARNFEDVRWIVDQVIPSGNMLLAARPKMRKTWLALQLSLAVTTGGEFMDFQCNKGDVLYLALEDNDRRIQNRIRTLQKFNIVQPDLSGFRYFTGGMGFNTSGRLVVTDPGQHQATLQAFPRGDEGVDALDQFLDEFPKTSLIIIDTLAHFRGERHSRDIYQSDYDAMMPLTKLAARRKVCIIPVTHEKKGNADIGQGGDFMEHVTGSAGLTGGSDGVISIKGRRGVQEENESRKILISGRDVPYDYELDAAFDAERGGWLKAAKEDIKVGIRGLLQKNPFLNQRDIQTLLPGCGQARIYRALTDMKLTGEIEQSRYGYSLKR